MFLYYFHIFVKFIVAITKKCVIIGLKNSKKTNMARRVREVNSENELHFFLDILRENFGSIQGIINVESGEFTEWARTDFYTNHGQINPKNDSLALCAYDYWNDLADGRLF